MNITTPTLQSERLRLRPFAFDDLDNIYAVLSNPIVVRYWDSPPWNDRKQAEQYIAKSQQVQIDQSGFKLAIERLDNNDLIGQCALFNWNKSFRSIGIGYCLTDTAWGKGYATEAVGTIITWAFQTLNVNRIQAETDTRNTESGRVLLKNRFVHEGTLRQDCIVGDEISDSHVYGLISADWLKADSQ